MKLSILESRQKFDKSKEKLRINIVTNKVFFWCDLNQDKEIVDLFWIFA